MKIHIINGYAPHTYKGDHFSGLARGRLAETLIDIMEDELSDNHELRITHIQDGYSKVKEQENIIWADIVIIHSPIYWFYVPAAMKKYIDDIYVPGVFTGENPSKKYGKSGVLTGKYMLSLTWNAPESAFEVNGFMEGDVDNVMINLHKTNQFVGLSPLATFSIHDVIKNPDIKEYERKLRLHLQKVIPNE